MRLDVEGLCVRFGGIEALADVSLSVPAGTIVGLIGPNGAGKTTLLNVVSGLVRPSRGVVRLGGRDVTRLRPAARARLGIARTFQHTGLVRDATVLANAVMAQNARMRGGVVAGIVGMASAEERVLVARARRALDRLGVGRVAGARVRDLPHGTLRLVELACALVQEPALLLLDEPSAGLDARETAALVERLVEVQAEAGFTAVVVDHDMRAVRGMSDRIVVLASGRVLTSGMWDQVRADPAVIEAYLGRHHGDRAVSRGIP